MTKPPTGGSNDFAHLRPTDAAGAHSTVPLTKRIAAAKAKADGSTPPKQRGFAARIAAAKKRLGLG